MRPTNSASNISFVQRQQQVFESNIDMTDRRGSGPATGRSQSFNEQSLRHRELLSRPLPSPPVEKGGLRWNTCCGISYFLLTASEVETLERKIEKLSRKDEEVARALEEKQRLIEEILNVPHEELESITECSPLNSSQVVMMMMMTMTMMMKVMMVLMM